MKGKVWIASLVSLFAIHANARLGAISGGGGKAVVCRDPSGKITSVEVLDLYEGRVVYGLSIQKSAAPMENQIQAALKVIPEVGTGMGLTGYLEQNIEHHMRLTPPGSTLISVDDALEVAIPTGCQAEQAANYFNDNLILINGNIWGAMDETNRAALLLHEAVYARDRIVGATDSQRSRHVVASLFDSSTKWVGIEDQVPLDALTCVSEQSFFKAYRDSGGSWILQFEILGPEYIMSKKTATFTDAPSPSNVPASMPADHSKEDSVDTIDFNEANTMPVSKGNDKIGLGISKFEMARSAFEDGDSIEIQKVWE